MLELGDLTCPEQAQWMKNNLKNLGHIVAFFAAKRIGKERILALVVGVVVFIALPGPQVVLSIVGWILVPLILGMLYVALGFALDVGDLSAANEWLFKFRPEQLSRQGILTAALAALSTLGAGVGIGLVFGSRSPQGLPLIRSVVAVGILDTAIMLVTAIVIVAVTAAVDVEMTQGLALLVVSLP